MNKSKIHKYAINILCGGIGTRLKNTIKNSPKAMAPVNGRPFLEFQLDWLCNQGFNSTTLATGFLKESVSSHFGKSYKNMNIRYSEEATPLGTGGAIQKAMDLADSDPFIVLNGDTMFDIDLAQLIEFHSANKADITLAIKPMRNFERYGTVQMNSEGRITGFSEKKPTKFGLINGGIYIISKPFLMSLPLPEKFSFEKDVLEKYVASAAFYGLSFDSYFIDIGVPEDYFKAQTDFARLFP